MGVISESTHKQGGFSVCLRTNLIMATIVAGTFGVVACQGNDSKSPTATEPSEGGQPVNAAASGASTAIAEDNAKSPGTAAQDGVRPSPAPVPSGGNTAKPEGALDAAAEDSELPNLSVEAILYYLKEAYVPVPHKEGFKGSEVLLEKLRISLLGVKARRCWQRIRAKGEWLESVTEKPEEVKERKRLLAMKMTVHTNDEGEPVQKPEVVFGTGQEPRLREVAKCLVDNAWKGLPITAPPPKPDPETGLTTSYQRQNVVIPWHFASPLDDAKKGFMCGFGPRKRIPLSKTQQAPADQKPIYSVYQVVLQTLLEDAEDLVVAVTTQVPDEPGNFAGPPPTVDEKIALIQGRVPKIKESTITSFRQLRPPAKELVNGFGLPDASLAMANRTQMENFFGSKDLGNRRGWRCFEELYPRGFYVRLSDVAFDAEKLQALVHVTRRKSWSWFTREYLLLEKRGSAWHMLERFPAHRF